ncbi:hypothetical protein RSSM_02259 [Rhodopirellula sallentina SM41]|uniref:Uncharacterized protein n=1 Tax=Rhodopirellula sallentina SM41 TaxID=1263870 RepID=M5UEN0_9BACT|nr:hypothetical protein RSSM_02259 [Rhodopirellula sallentina SM41]
MTTGCFVLREFPNGVFVGDDDDDDDRESDRFRLGDYYDFAFAF